MGIPFSCPGPDFDERFDAVIVRSFSFDGGDVRPALRSVSFNGRGSEPTILKSLGSGKMIFEGSVSFKNSEVETKFSIKSLDDMEEQNVVVKPVSKEIKKTFSRCDSFDEQLSWVPRLDSTGIPKHEAALKLQKVYKSFRTRRKLADCAVLVEQGWWKLLDFAELKRSSVSFFDIEKHETAVSRWSRARTRAAKVGKGLSKDDKAQKLALQHWLEAIDPRHRYGHNLHFYYVTWLRCDSRQPFFYWLDIGDGREVNIVDNCPRSRLQQQCIKYLGPTERKNYEVIVEDGKFSYKVSGKLIDTSESPEDTKWIFVLSTSKTLYIGQKRKGVFQHSSFLAGGATSAAGRLVIENGILKAVWPHSGHYRPTEQNFQEFVSFLMEHNVDLTDVKKSPTDEDEDPMSIHSSSIGLASNSSEEDLANAEENSSKNLKQKRSVTGEDSTNAGLQPPKPKRALRFVQKLKNLEIPKRDGLFVKSESDEISMRCNRFSMGSPVVFSSRSPMAGYETADESFEGDEDDCMVPKRNLFEKNQEENEDEPVSEESIIRRINTKKGLHSYQLGKQLSCKWTTGAGPRIGCVRDYPSELQFRALEQVNLSPRSSGVSRAFHSHWNAMGMSPKLPTPTNLCRETTATTRTDLR